MAYETVPIDFTKASSVRDCCKLVQSVIDSYVESHEKAVLVTVIPITFDGKSMYAVAVFANG